MSDAGMGGTPVYPMGTTSPCTPTDTKPPLEPWVTVGASVSPYRICNTEEMHARCVSMLTSIDSIQDTRVIGDEQPGHAR